MLIKRKKILVTVVVFLILALLAGCAKAPAPAPSAPQPAPAPAAPAAPAPSAPAVPAPESIKIGGIISFTGPDSNLGSMALAGYEIAVDHINKAGGVYVKEFDKNIPLELVTMDMESKVETAIARAETLVAKEGVIAFVGTTYISAAVGIAERHRVPSLIIASALQDTHERGYTYWFSVAGKTPDSSKLTFEILDTIPENDRPKKVAIFEEQSDFGIEQSKYFQKYAAEAGYEVVSVGKYAMVSRDLSPLILEAKAAGAEAVLSSPITPDAMTFVRQMAELDYNPKLVLMIRGVADQDWIRAMGPLGNYIFSRGGWHHALSYPGIAELNADYQTKMGRTTDSHAGPAYASIQVLADAIERAGTLDRQTVRDALAATDMMTVAGPVKFRENGTNITPPNAETQWINGKLELVYPPSEPNAVPMVYPMPKWKER